MEIASHFEDFDAFGPVILTISLISPLYMTLKKPTTAPTIVEPGSNSDSNNNNNNACDSYDDVVKILLEPGSLLILKDDARFKYRHGIGKYKWIDIPPPKNQYWQSEDDESSPSENPEALLPTTAASVTRIKRGDSYRRVSLTIRHLLSTRRKVQDKEDESDTIKDPSAY
uniref:Alpha-ketoglutarate-dependent dioxygenase AlkB-like domain-containing protein n=1 Tax=Pseudo-nitzschia australis TaxID=44445 RepID=A0A7S4AF13_9STRA